MNSLCLFYRCSNCDHLIYGADLNNAQCRICVGGWLHPVSLSQPGLPPLKPSRACSWCGAVWDDRAPLDHLCYLCGQGFITPIQETEIWVSREEVSNLQSQSATTAAKPTLDSNSTS